MTGRAGGLVKSGDSVVYEQRAVFQRNIKERNAFNAARRGVPGILLILHLQP